LIFLCFTCSWAVLIILCQRMVHVLGSQSAVLCSGVPNPNSPSDGTWIISHMPMEKNPKSLIYHCQWPWRNPHIVDTMMTYRGLQILSVAYKKIEWYMCGSELDCSSCHYGTRHMAKSLFCRVSDFVHTTKHSSTRQISCFRWLLLTRPMCEGPSPSAVIGEEPVPVD